MTAKYVSVPASEVKPSDVVRFSGTNYKARSVLLKPDFVRISFWDTNAEQHYFYEPNERLEVLTKEES